MMVGHNAKESADESAFSFDNESPRHAQWLAPYALMNRLVTHGEWLAFVQDGGYRDPCWWLSAGWDWVQSQRIEAPLYWQRSLHSSTENHADWYSFTLHCTPRDLPQLFSHRCALAVQRSAAGAG